MKSILIFFSFLLISSVTLAQAPNQKPINEFLEVGVTNFSFGYGLEFPGGDLAERFSDNLKFTLGVERITKSNWIFGLEFSYMFGDTVKEDVLEPLRLANAEILGSDNGYADIFTRQRGLFIGVNFGKLIPFNADSRSGLRITGAAGILSHYVRIVDEANSTPQIEGSYLKGYDRLTRGLAFREFVGYQHISEDKRINFYIGLEFTQGFTTPVRAVDFDTGLPPSSDTRFDSLIGLKAAWILPFFDDYVDEQVFY